MLVADAFSHDSSFPGLGGGFFEELRPFRTGQFFNIKEGVFESLRQEGRGIGLYNKLDAYSLQDDGHDTFDANRILNFGDDLRDYHVAGQMLQALGVRSIRLLSNNPRKLVGIEGYGLSVSEWLPLEIPASDSTRRYLKTKKEKLGHKLSSV